MITEPGIYLDIDPADYLDDPCPEPSCSQSLVKILLEKSPAHARYAHPQMGPGSEEQEEDYAKARAIGDAAHMLLLRRGKRLAIGEFDSWRSSEAKAFKAAALRERKTPILAAHFDVAQQIRSVTNLGLECAGLNVGVLGTGDSEVVLAWQERGFWCRTMIDRICPYRRHIIDLKTTERSAAPHAVSPMVVDWALQAAMHERGLDALDPDNAGRRTHTFVVIEQYPPFAMCIYDLPESVLHMGRKRLEIGLARWGECMRTGVWPSYPTEPQTPMLPGWVEKQWLEQELAHEERRREPSPQWDTLEEKRMDLPNDLIMGG